MSGHSKWNNIKRTKGKSDAQKAKIFTKLGREIAVSVKLGGADPDTNNRLKDAINKAKQNNMPNDSIYKAVNKSLKDNISVNYEDLIYEGYGTGGCAVMVLCLTDNRNRTASDVRHAFDKYNGSLGQTGSVSFLFLKKGVILVEKNNDFDSLFELMLNFEAEDIEELEDGYLISSKTENFRKILAELETNKYNILSSEIEYVPSTYITLNPEQKIVFEKMLSQLDDLDDVSVVYHNAILD